MAEHGHYEFKNPVARWFDARLPILSMAKVHALDYPTPRNLNYFWTFGGILAVCSWFRSSPASSWRCIIRRMSTSPSTRSSRSCAT